MDDSATRHPAAPKARSGATSRGSARHLGQALLLVALAVAGVQARPRLTPYVRGVPYFNQHHNTLDPGGSCQNTCMAMVLAHYGAAITPDDITSRWGTGPGQAVNGWQDIFNELAAEQGLAVRDRGISDGRVSQVRRQLADGYPVVVHGSFNSGHLIVLLGFDGDSYYVHDPAGDWLMGHPSGRHSRYGREPLERAITNSGHWVRFHSLYSLSPSALAVEPVLPDSVVSGQRVRIAARLQPTGEAAFAALEADLSALGGPSRVPLTPGADGACQLLADFVAAGQGLAEIAIRTVDGGDTLYTRDVAVLAPADLTVFADQPAAGWSVSSADAEVAVSPALAATGQQSLAITGSGIDLVLRPERPLPLHGFSHLRLSFHSGDTAVGGDSLLAVYVNDDIRAHAILHGYGAAPRLEPERRAWQTVEIPMAELAFAEQPLESLHLLGHLSGTAYVDDVQLVAARPCPVGIAWRVPPPDSLRLGESTALALQVQVTRQVEGAAPPDLVADLSALGGPAAARLEPMGAASFGLQVSLRPEGVNGRRQTSVRITQTVDGITRAAQLDHTVVLVPELDCPIYAGVLDWPISYVQSCEVTPSVEDADLDGHRALAVDADYFTIVLEAPVPVEPVGYRALRLAFHAGEVTPPDRPAFSLQLNGDVRTTVRLMGDDEDTPILDPGQDGWQVATVPLSAFGDLEEPIQSIRLLGNLHGRFYLDDIRLLAAEVGTPTTTAVAETPPLPGAAALEPAYPNPFNSAITLAFSLATAGPAELIIRNSLGQVVWHREPAWLEPGSHRIMWNGRQTGGQAAATGVYFAQLVTPTQTWTRPLLLLR